MKISTFLTASAVLSILLGAAFVAVSFWLNSPIHGIAGGWLLRSAVVFICREEAAAAIPVLRRAVDAEVRALASRN